jgi:stearoyl-CoA desaturase (delta-9 desaturase)
MFKGVSIEVDLSSYYLILPSLLFCGLPSSILHNCAHGNWGKKINNTVLGELCGTIMLYGYKGFKLGHMFHHSYPDNPDYDVHPPAGYTFVKFLVSPIKDTIKVIEKVYYESFGDNKVTRRNILLQKIAANICIVLRLIFVYLLLGPTLFVFVYLTIYISNVFVFAHINYAAHIEKEDGSFEVVNLNHNLYYKVINVLSCGGYFHKSHHLKPRFKNPALVQINNKEDYITFVPGTTV